MKVKKRGLFSQRNMGRQWGIFTQVAGQLAIVMGIMNLFLIAVTAYNTTLAGWMIEHGVDLGGWLFLGILVGILVVASVLLYKFGLPSVFSFWNDQFYRHDNPMRKDLVDIKKLLTDDLDYIKERLDNLERGKVKMK
jgi:hypothetical protein